MTPMNLRQRLTPLIQRLVFSLWYYSRPPWDTGVSPPELLAFIEEHSPGRAIDLGCGTGTNAITLAQHGWQVVAVDFAPRAIHIARRKARRAGVHVDFRVNDVTRLDDLAGPFDLALDIGCFHGLGERKKAYLDQLDRLLAPGGFWLMYGFFTDDPSRPGPGLVASDLDMVPASMRLVRREDGSDKIGRASVWVLYQKTA
ncbi:MAG: class I SAM-dependent methyltransferase [Anaerolineae bacterium]|nr:MAG: class I SAM-dependent methyltransferase [Anaerolineae bacterium]